ncbi:hypothetical protein OPT61_g9097 [Boeremia exigua]|uniref:Uncharacterized protein n=1 Tax=Boeremia exigua TaxID=749465 RepID=A0ACC2HW63_9PLEO|nr:hypothetical protein OPT61_g9097 [Boeremia exigua]
MSQLRCLQIAECGSPDASWYIVCRAPYSNLSLHNAPIPAGFHGISDLRHEPWYVHKSPASTIINGFVNIIFFLHIITSMRCPAGLSEYPEAHSYRLSVSKNHSPTSRTIAESAASSLLNEACGRESASSQVPPSSKRTPSPPREMHTRIRSQDTGDIAQSGSPSLILGYIPGRRLSELSSHLTTAEQRTVDRTLGYYVRSLTSISATQFGMSQRVFDNRGCKSWREAFFALLEAALRDAEDILVTIPYDSIRYYLTKHSHVLEEVIESRLVALDICRPDNVLVDEGTKQVTGLVGFSNVIWGDVLMSGGIANGSEAFFEGYGECPVRTGSVKIRMLMYTVYRSILAIVTHHYRPHTNLDELEVRRELVGALNELARFPRHTIPIHESTHPAIFPALVGYFLSLYSSDGDSAPFLVITGARRHLLIQHTSRWRRSFGKATSRAMSGLVYCTQYSFGRTASLVSPAVQLKRASATSTTLASDRKRAPHRRIRHDREHLDPLSKMSHFDTAAKPHNSCRNQGKRTHADVLHAQD